MLNMLKFVGLCFIAGAAAQAGAMSLGLAGGALVNRGITAVTSRVVALTTRSKDAQTVASGS